MNGSPAMRTMLFLLALPLAAQTVLVVDDVTGTLVVGSLAPDVEWDRPTRKIKTKAPTPPPVSTIHTPRTSVELQATIDKAAGGDEIHLAAGLTYSGNFNLSGKAAPVTIRTADLAWSTSGKRVKPSDAPRMARVQTPNSAPAFYAGKDADNWRLVGLDLTNSDAVHSYNIVHIGDLNEARSLAELPNNFTIDRCYIHGAKLSARRGVLAMGTNIAITNSYIDNFFAQGVDSQAILVPGGRGPTLIENNFLEGAGENLFLSAESPHLGVDAIPENVTIRRNHLKKRLAWMLPGTGLVIKNLFEIKAARHVLVEANVMENNPVAGQSGFGVLFTARTGLIPEISDVKFRLNKIINSANGINVLGKNGEGAPGDLGRVFDLIVENNLFEGEMGRFLMCLNAIESLSVRHNTALGAGSHIMLSDGPMSGRIDFMGNAIGRGMYGIQHTGTGEGTRSIVAFWRAWDVSGNAFVGAAIPDWVPGAYPPGNTFVKDAAAIPPGVGCDMAALEAAVAGVVQ